MKVLPLGVHVAQYVALDSDVLRQIESFRPLRTLQARESLYTPQHGPATLVYVEEGLVRLFLVDDYQRERTVQFGLEGWWLSDWDSFEKSQPGQLTLQAVETARLRVFDSAQFETLLGTFPLLERYFRCVFQRAHAAGQRKALLIETKSGEQMYRDFRDNHPDFLQRVPQSLLASYLGISPEYLSRIRGRS